jgi:hypothetical protein
MVNALFSIVVNSGFEPESCQIKDYYIDICSFFAMYTSPRNKSKVWLAWNQNVSDQWADIFTRGLLLQ